MKNAWRPYRQRISGNLFPTISVVLVLLHLISGVAGPLHLILHAHSMGDEAEADLHSSCSAQICGDPIHILTLEADHTLDLGCQLCNLCVRPPVSFLPSRSVELSIQPTRSFETILPRSEDFRSDLSPSEASPRAPPTLI